MSHQILVAGAGSEDDINKDSGIAFGVFLWNQLESRRLGQKCGHCMSHCKSGIRPEESRQRNGGTALFGDWL
ncbi:MAG: hypothetical protein GX325_06955 [Peptococcaceae bacterium]|nr:hypothetical protein [Peptococcaceae bacterium]